MDDSTYVCETDAGAFKLVVPMEALKDSEQLVDILHVESRPIIPHKDLNFIGVSFGGANFDLGLRPGGGEFQRIGDQIHEDLA
jgi:hypothetical protein